MNRSMYAKMTVPIDRIPGKNVPDWFIAIPRAALTIALIPPILKYVFGIEKKKSASQPKPPPEIFPPLDFLQY